MQVIGDRPGLELESVLYAADFSEYSVNAGKYAAYLAGHFTADLIVAHAFTLTEAALRVESQEKTSSQQRKDLSTRLEQTIASLTYGPVESRAVLEEGDPAEVIESLAEKHAPCMLVTGTHGGGRVERHLIGSVAQNILRHTRWPVMTVGPHVRAVSAVSFPFRRILYATDFSPAAAHAAPYAIAMAEAFGGEIDVLNVVQPNAVEHPDRFEEMRARFYKVLERLVPDEAREFCDPRTFVQVGEPREQILHHARERQTDLIVLGVRRDSFLGMQLRTTGAFKVILESECPVLTVAG